MIDDLRNWRRTALVVAAIVLGQSAGCSQTDQQNGIPRESDGSAVNEEISTPSNSSGSRAEDGPERTVADSTADEHAEDHAPVEESLTTGHSVTDTSNRNSGDETEPAVADASEPSLSGQFISLPRLRFSIPTEWIQEPASSSMRAAQFALPAPAEQSDLDPAALVVYDFGPSGAGSVEANLNRWVGQIAQPNGSDSMASADRELIEQDDCTVHYLAVAGNYVARPMPGQGQMQNKADQKLVAAIVQTGGGPYYFKLVGPEAVVNAWHDEIIQMIESFDVPG